MRAGNTTITYDITEFVMKANMQFSFDVEHGENVAATPYQQRIEAVRWLLESLMYKNLAETFDDGTCLMLKWEFDDFDEALQFRDSMNDVEDVWAFLALLVPDMTTHWVHCRLNDGPVLEVAVNMLDEIKTNMTRRGIKFDYSVDNESGNYDADYINYSVLIEV